MRRRRRRRSDERERIAEFVDRGSRGRSARNQPQVSCLAAVFQWHYWITQGRHAEPLQFSIEFGAGRSSCAFGRSHDW